MLKSLYYDILYWFEIDRNIRMAFYFMALIYISRFFSDLFIKENHVLFQLLALIFAFAHFSLLFGTLYYLIKSLIFNLKMLRLNKETEVNAQ